MASDCSKLKWSKNPGAYEAQLMRRCNNPYFPATLQIISDEELREAKKIDDSDFNLVRGRFEQLTKKLHTSPASFLSSEFHRLREALDDIIRVSMGVGGSAYDIAKKADKLRETLIAAMRSELSNDPDALENIQTADAFHERHTTKFLIPIMAQILRDRSPIKKEDTIRTIMSEDAKTYSARHEHIVRKHPSANAIWSTTVDEKCPY